MTAPKAKPTDPAVIAERLREAQARGRLTALLLFRLVSRS
jgi:hypothetical protein